MAAFYQNFITARTVEADQNSIFNSLRAFDPTVGIYHPELNKYRLKKNSAWLPAQISAAQNIIDTAPDTTLQLTAQGEIDEMRISIQAIILTLVDEINILRAQHSLPARTPSQIFQAIRAKAGTL